MTTQRLAVLRTITLFLGAYLAPLDSANAIQALNADAQSLAITYHTTPQNRAAFLAELQSTGVAQFARWKKEGVVRSFSILVNRYADSGTWDAISLLTFAKPNDVARWQEIEHKSPAGLTAKALALTSAIETTPVDLVRAKSDADHPADPVFLVIPYEVLIPTGEYLEYADGYTIPQFDGWMREGVLAGYEIFVSRYPAGRPWSSLIVLEYRSEQALVDRDATVSKVRAQLRDDPKWKAISDNKKNVRNEKQLVVAEQIRPTSRGD